MIIKNEWEYTYTAEYNAGTKRFEVIATHQDNPDEQIMLLVPMGAYKAIQENRKEAKEWLAMLAG